MNYGGDAADQIVRYSMEGMEHTLRISGSIAKNLAVLIVAVMKDQKKTRGKTNLLRMLKEQRAMKFFTIPHDRLREFAGEAKSRGLLYVVIRDKKNPQFSEIMVFADDAAKVNRVLDKMNLDFVKSEAGEAVVEQAPVREAERVIDAEFTEKTEAKEELPVKTEKVVLPEGTIEFELDEEEHLFDVGEISPFRYIDGDISMENVLLLMAFAGIVLVGGCVVIQSIFRISIIDKIKSYGQLRTIGATKKQIMRIVKKEGHSLGWKGMSIGILLGLGVTLLLFPKGFSLSGYLLVIGCTVLICWTMICLSIRKPVKLAANISPVEAVRFTSLQKKIKNRAKRKKISPCSLGMLNFRRDWKKTVSIVFSLSLGGILLLAVSSLLLLQSPEKMARQHFKNGDYKIYIDSDREHIDLLKQGNPLNEELKQEVLGIDGVEDILVTRKSASYGATFGGITARGTCDMITNENKELLAQAVVEGSMPGDNSILLKDDYRDFDGKEKLGETIELSLGEKTIPVTISGFFDGKKTDFASGHGSIGVDGPMMFLSEELFQELIPDVTNFDYSWDIVCDPEKSEKVGKALENLVVSHTDIGLDTFEDKVDSYGYMDVAYGVMQVISWFIFLFGVINLSNTTLSNQYSRRQENSVLRSIGLAPKQLAQMTVWEGMVYVVSSILLMLAIGLPITLLVWRKFSISAYAGRILPYEFPWLQMGVYVVVLVTVELILSVWTIRRQKKQSLIEQMRSME